MTVLAHDQFTSHPPVPFGGYLTPKLAPLVELGTTFSTEKKWNIARMSAETTVNRAFSKLLDKHECDYCKKLELGGFTEGTGEISTGTPAEGGVAEPTNQVMNEEVSRGDEELTSRPDTHDSILQQLHERFSFVVSCKDGVPSDKYLVKFVEDERATRLAKYSRSYLQSCMAPESLTAVVTVGGLVLGCFKTVGSSSTYKAMKYTFGCALVANQCLAVKEYAKTPSVRVRNERNTKFEAFCKLQIEREDDISGLAFFEVQFNKSRRNNKKRMVDLSTCLSKYIAKYKGKADEAAGSNAKIKWAKQKFQGFMTCEIQKDILKIKFRTLSVQIEKKEKSIVKSKELSRKAAEDHFKKLALRKLPRAPNVTNIVSEVSNYTKRLEGELVLLQQNLSDIKAELRSKEVESKGEYDHFQGQVVNFSKAEKITFNTSVAPYLLLLQYNQCKMRLESDKKFTQAEVDLIQVGVDDLLINGSEKASMSSVIHDYEKRKAEEILGIEPEYFFPDIPTHPPGQHREPRDVQIPTPEEPTTISDPDQEYDFPDVPTDPPRQSPRRSSDVETPRVGEAASVIDGATQNPESESPEVHTVPPVQDSESQ